MMPPPALTEAAAALCFGCVLLIPCAVGGLAIMAAGMCRSRNVAHTLLSALCAAAVAAAVYFVLGSALQGYPGRPACVLWAGGKFWGWLGCDPLLLRGMEADASARPLALLYGLFAVCLAAVIPLGAAAERWRLRACCASTAVFAGFVYPLFAHWVWGGGWLAQLGENFGLGAGFLDTGGGATVQTAGGLTALAVVWIVGPRRGKYHAEGMPAAMPAHNVTFVLLGCLLAWLGFLGLDCAGAFLFGGVGIGQAAVVPINATVAAACALLAAVVVTRARFRIVDASICANAWVAGLVASSTGAAAIRPAGAAILGLVAGALVVFAVEWLDLRLRIDDPGGAVAVHAVGGLWGILATGALSRSQDQWLAQLVGIAALLGFVLPAAYGANRLLDRFIPYRVSPEAERRGLDLHELGAGAYPDFMTHSEDL